MRCGAEPSALQSGDVRDAFGLLKTNINIAKTLIFMVRINNTRVAGFTDCGHKKGRSTHQSGDLADALVLEGEAPWDGWRGLEGPAGESGGIKPPKNNTTVRLYISVENSKEERIILEGLSLEKIRFFGGMI